MADMYDEEFKRYMRLSKKLLGKLKDRKDVMIGKRWIQKLTSLKSDDLMVKKNRNFFFKYLLQVMHDGVLEGPFQELPFDDNLHTVDEQDGRTYVAAKPIPGCGALIYMAVSKDSSQGWDMPGKIQPRNL
ncbi:hypothetical protein C0J52_01488 [Blattella germanica]|nr:hypothetical protein C0J52_01488 [Blattella germanica]